MFEFIMFTRFRGNLAKLIQRRKKSATANSRGSLPTDPQEIFNPKPIVSSVKVYAEDSQSYSEEPEVTSYYSEYPVMEIEQREFLPELAKKYLQQIIEYNAQITILAETIDNMGTRNTEQQKAAIKEQICVLQGAINSTLTLLQKSYHQFSVYGREGEAMYEHISEHFNWLLEQEISFMYHKNERTYFRVANPSFL